MRRDLTQEQVELFLKMQGEEATRQEIADAIGVSFSVLKRLISSRRLPYMRPPTNPAPIEVVPEKNPEEGLTLMQKCKMILGARMGEDHRGYTLDGRPVSSAQIAKAAGLSIGPAVKSATKEPVKKNK